MSACIQLYNLLPKLTAEKNVELPLLLTNLSGGTQERAVALKVVGWRSCEHCPASYPEVRTTRRHRPCDRDRSALLLCDEPTGDLDRKAGDEILDLLQTLNRDHGKTIVMVTHDPHAAGRAKRTLHLEKGVLERGAGDVR
jgi:putative ABC transport system ATP-binding protein